MTHPSIDQIQSRLRGLTIPYTGEGLGEGGSDLAVEQTESGINLRIKLGFPAKRYGPTLAEAVKGHCQDLVPHLSVGVEWSIKTHTVQPSVQPLPGIHNLIAVASGKGGVGKSTLAINLALALRSEGGRVGILDADIYGPSQPRMLGAPDAQPDTQDGKTLEPIQAHGLSAMSIGFLVDENQPTIWRGPMVTSALNQLLSQTRWPELDYLVVDMPPGTGDIQLTLAQKVPVSGAVIVTTPQDIALADARKGLAMFVKVNVPVLGVIENMSYHICEECGHESHLFGEGGGKRLAEQYDCPMLGQIPLDPVIREQTDSGQPTVKADPDGPLALAYLEAARHLAGRLALRPKDYSHRFGNIAVEQPQQQEQQ